jgi:hypothetical protein
MAAGPLTRRRGLQPFQCEVRRIYIPRTRVNKGKKEGLRLLDLDPPHAAAKRCSGA